MNNLRKASFSRRVDDLGRIAIPKEIRRELAINEGDQLELFITRDNEIVLKKIDGGSYASS
jgi:AbrB family transcriptional regulator (stage V sporulation protein T)